MPISIFEAALYLAYAEQPAVDHEIAVAIDRDRVLAIGIDDAQTPNDSRSAMINLMQNNNLRRAEFVATTYRPHERCLGMAQMQGIDTIVFIDNGRLRMKTMGGVAWVEHDAYLAGSRQLAAFDIGGFAAATAGTRRQNARQWIANLRHLAPNPMDPHYNAALTFQQTATNAPRSRRFNTPRLDMPHGLADIGARVDNAARHDIYMNLAFAVLSLSFNDDRFASAVGGHNIGSVLRGPNDALLGWGLNSGSIDSTLHGEVNLIQNYHRRTGGATLAGSWLYTTLEPCHMCAAMIADSGVNIRVFYGQADPGINGNALARHCNGCGQEYLQTLTGHHLTTTHGARGGPITGFLASDDAYEELSEAADRYFDTEPAAHSPDHAVWSNGLALLRHINPVIDTLHSMRRRG